MFLVKKKLMGLRQITSQLEQRQPQHQRDVVQSNAILQLNLQDLGAKTKQQIVTEDAISINDLQNCKLKIPIFIGIFFVLIFYLRFKFLLLKSKQKRLWKLLTKKNWRLDSQI